MKNNKLMKFFLMMMVAMLVLAGCNGEAKRNEADRERLDAIAVEVDALYNENKDDLADDVDEETLKNVLKLLEEENEVESELSEENQELYDGLVTLYEEAFDMFKFETLLLSLINDEGKVDEAEFKTVQDQLNAFQHKETYFKRLTAELDNIGEVLETQLALEKQVSELEEAFASLYTKKGELKEDVSDKDFKKVKKLVEAIDDEEYNAEFDKQLNKLDKEMKAVAKAKKEEEERLAKEKADEEARQLAEATKQKEQSNQSNNTTTNNSSSNQTASNNTTNKKPNTNNNSSSSGSQSNNKGSSNSNSNQSSGSSNQSSGSNNNNSNSGTTETKPKTKEVLWNGSIGNSGKEFKSYQEAWDYGMSQLENKNSKWYGEGYWVLDIDYWHVDEAGNRVKGTNRKTWTVDFYIPKQ